MDNQWYKTAVIYELYIKAFQDSSRDGRGDFAGLTSRLDYLKDLGIDCIWMLPTYPSPGRDDGYDVMDYNSINPEYGSLRDFIVFLDEAHKRGIKVLIELVLNHTSDRHPWFVEAKKGPQSKFHDYYVWSDTSDKYSKARVIFTDSEQSNWAWCAECQKYYWHRFYYHQPDLNFDNPAVREEMKKIISFWLDLGVDGFRADAVPYLFEREGTNCENLAETHDYLKELRKMIDDNYKDRVLLAEANQWPEDLLPYFGSGDEFHMAFNFPLMPRMFMALKQEHHGPIVDIINRMPKIPDSCQWVIFLRNHDELTLEMCTDEERDYMYSQYAYDAQMKINVGIRRRLAPLVENDRRKIELLYALLFTLPGSPVIYYGDEIGMGDNIYLGDRNGVRTPMQWDENKNSGFSDCKPSMLYAPVITDPEYNYNAVNVNAQLANPHSLLNFVKKMISARKLYNNSLIFGCGEIIFLYPENKKILVFIRRYKDDVVLCSFNLSDTPQPVAIDLKEYEGYEPIEIFGNTKFPSIGALPYLLTHSPYGCYLFYLKKHR
ncbi:MAG: maltose alpha-D-glucosyltransferase [Candidatus Wallbacteria bacterium GWC2_49_35]|uniref:maltose alpha-D-glucosyltransferase n=1 Tax=Candidatus Wallbacteria bacterium GWC2_49_35 TaxID=1817813 RepID=A0A1F7WI12_9BACT|nr:MAG: maltose alpha-D-glucosyltransferase [Candidatus Wallbacteria bacterium GWC2_49_35]HBC74870.1 maltose alpha-D-glucosyltransferase [Candidatus Wallbacteria bacterium]